MAITLILNDVMVDWLTLTSYDDNLYKIASGIIKEIMPRCQVTNEAKIMQYVGVKLVTRNESGTLFAGSAIDGNGRLHTMVQMSGELSHRYKDMWQSLTKMGVVKCTRLDLQVTIIQPSGYEQIDLFNTLREKGVNASFIESGGDRFSQCKLATVGIGSRTSQKYTRIYQKVAEDGAKLLRCEFEFKAHKANSLWRVICDYPERMPEIYSYELKIVKHPIAVAFKPTDNEMQVVATRDKQDNRRDWFTGSVLPSLFRYLNETNDSDLAIAFIKICEEAMSAGDSS